MMASTQRRRTLGIGSAFWSAVAIALLCLGNAAADAWRAGSISAAWQAGGFLHIELRDGVPIGALVDILSYGATTALVAVGMALVVAGRGIDLSVGSVMAIAATIAATLVTRGASPWLAIGAALGASALCGLWNGAMVAFLRLQPFVATLVLMVAGRGIAQLVSDGQIVTFRDGVLEYLGNGRPAWLPLPFAFLLAAAVAIVVAIVLRRTAAGLLLEAVGSNPSAARLCGTPERRVVIVTYVTCALCAGLAGLVSAARIRAADPTHIGVAVELNAVFAVVAGGASLAGGRVHLLGAVVGAFLLQTLTTTMYARDVSADVAPLPIALVILGVCLISSPQVREGLARRLRRRAPRLDGGSA
ncbi:MAG: ABC transporter permease [Phycisphaerales bacterium]